MASSEARRQKKLKKQKARRQQKHTVIARRTSNDPGIVLQHVETWPIHDVRVPSNLWKNGMGSLFIARWSPQRQFVFASFLLDTYYLGVKDAVWKICTPSQFEGVVKNAASNGNGSMQKVDPAYFVKLINEMVQWSMTMTGSRPHPEFRHASKLLAGIDASSCPATFDFGMNGKPMFIAGPHDPILVDDDLFDLEEDDELDEEEPEEGDYVVEGQVVKVWEKP